MLSTRITLAAATAAAALLTVSAPALAGPVSISQTVEHDVTFTAHFDDDICGLRSSWTTFNAKVAQSQLIERTDGSWSYRDVAAVAYVSDYDDPNLPTLYGRLTEVNHLVLTPGETFVVANTFHDFFGDVKIWSGYHLTVVDREPMVEFEILEVVGCP